MNSEFIGVISDTHGLVRPEALQVLTGAQLIIHAGDIGKPEVLTALQKLAPVVAIRGNVDKGAWTDALPERGLIDVFGQRACIIHNLNELEQGAVDQFDLIISGHSHKPQCHRVDDVLYLNPGSAGPRRFTLPIAVGRLFVSAGVLQGEIIELAV